MIILNSLTNPILPITSSDTYHQSALKKGYKKRSPNLSKKQRELEDAALPPIPLKLTEYDQQIAGRYKKAGLLSTISRRKLDIWGTRAYLTRCDCGSLQYLTAEEMLTREGLGIGCGDAFCPSIGLAQTIWCQPLIALQLQLVQAVTVFPDRVDPSLKGLSPEEGATQLLNELSSCVVEHSGIWWFQDVRDNDIVAEQIALCDRPDRWLFYGGIAKARWDNDVMTVEELARDFNVPADTAMDLRVKLFDEDLIEALIGEYHDKK